MGKGLVPATIIMFAGSLLLGWLPLIGPAIAGFVGGTQAGAVGTAIAAAIIPSLFAALVVWGIASLFDIGLLAGLIGAGLFVILAVQSLPLLVGAWLGGTMSERRRIG